MKPVLVVCALAVLVAGAGSAAVRSGVDYGLYRARIDGSTRGRTRVLFIDWNSSICDLSPDRERMLIYADRGVATADVRGARIGPRSPTRPAGTRSTGAAGGHSMAEWSPSNSTSNSGLRVRAVPSCIS